MPRILYSGADIRVPPDLASARWTPEQRERYLLRSEVGRPLSFDRLVWSRPQGICTSSAEGVCLACNLARETEPEIRLPWVKVDEVLRIAAASSSQGLGRVVIATGVVAEDDREVEWLMGRFGVEADIDPQPAWAFLGFDVADGDISGLCNCGYSPDEVVSLRPIWRPRLNEHGLFRDLDDALAFRKLTDKRVPEHAPFFVYGLWMVGPAPLA